jgi:hypothetical protein
MSRPSLSPTERRRLVGILGLLASDFAGERAAAGLLATRLLQQRGVSWADVIGGGNLRTSSAAQAGPVPGPAWREALAFCRRFTGVLSDWEVDFVASLCGRRAPPTPGQLAKLVQIADALRARGFA